MARIWAFILSLALGALLAWSSYQPPAPEPSTASAHVFSAERAMADVRAIARAPHPMGSAENRRVRDYLASRLRALGAEVRIQRATALGDAKFSPPGMVSGGTVENLIAVVPGRDRSGPALALMAHYDSVANSPGAADDAAGVAAALEVARALTVEGPPARDLVLLLTDGEEFGLYGAKAFWSDDPLRTRIKAVINMEARGSSGPAFMFETGRGNAHTVAVYAGAVKRPEANSLSVWVYERMPNGTDFTLPKEAGVQGLNFAFVGRPFDYHSASSTPDALDRGSLQHMGGQALDAARGLLALEGAPEKREDAVYAGLFGRVTIAYPAWVGWLLVGACAGLIVVAVLRARAAGPMPVVSMLKGAGLVLLVLTFTALVLRTGYRLSPVGEHFYQSRMGAAFGLFLAGVVLLGGGAALWAVRRAFVDSLRWTLPLAGLALGVACSLFGGFDPVGTGLAVGAAVLGALVGGRAAEPRAAWAGVLAFGLLLAAALQAFAAPTAFLVTWPLLVASAAAALTASGGARGGWATALLALAAVLSLGWIGRIAAFLFDSLGLSSPELLAICAVLATFALIPLAAAWAERRAVGAATSGVLAGLGALCLVWVAIGDPYSARFPRPTHALHVTDLATGRAVVASAHDRPDPWTKSVLATGGEPRRAPLPALWWDDGWQAPSSATKPTSPPTVEAEREGAQVRIRVSDALSREIRLQIASAGPLAAPTVQGRTVRGTEAGAALKVRWQAAGPEGVTVVLNAPEAVNVRWTTVRDGWPEDVPPLPPRGPARMPVGASDSTVLTGAVTVR